MRARYSDIIHRSIYLSGTALLLRVVGETAMFQHYDGSGRMRDRGLGFLHGLRTTGVVLKIVALIGIVVTYPLWGHLIPDRAR